MYKYALSIFALLTLWGCSDQASEADATGLFEAQETIISSEVSGTIEQLSIEEGQTLTAGQQIGYIDSLQLYLRKEQLTMQIQAVLSRRPDINSQVAALQEQLKTLQRDQQRIAKLVKAEAATQKQLDDIDAQIEIVKKQIDAQRTSLGTTSNSLSMETNPLRVQIAEMEDQLSKCRLVNPIDGIVLARYSNAHEVATPGKALYKIADLSEMDLRIYVTGDQLSTLKLNQEVSVRTDEGTKDYRNYKGTITWISYKAEFTPKTIQTKDERANLVYAVKVRVKNDGFLKIGMYGEVNF